MIRVWARLPFTIIEKLESLLIQNTCQDLNSIGQNKTLGDPIYDCINRDDISKKMHDRGWFIFQIHVIAFYTFCKI